MEPSELFQYPLRKFPLGVPSWDSIRRRNLFFVDKTAKLDSLVTDFSRVFISRPRRMGKTSLCLPWRSCSLTGIRKNLREQLFMATGQRPSAIPSSTCLSLVWASI